jgi:hypothetical protein
MREFAVGRGKSGGGKERQRRETRKDEKRKSGHGVPCPYENLIPRWE